ncbi:MAG: T9SS type A sorting domain-containing protein [Bacteroidota bacterium]
MKKHTLKAFAVLALTCIFLVIWKTGILLPEQPNQRLEMIEFESEEHKAALQEARAAYDFKLLRNPLTNTIPKEDVNQAFKVAKKVPELDLNKGVTNGQKTLPTIGVDERGPSNFGGRTRAFAFDSRNQQIIVAGGVSGGIFRSVDGGNNWTDVTPAGEIHNVTSIVQDQDDEDIWYAASGEQIGNSASGSGAPYFGNGIWKSIDNGITWTILPATSGTLEGFDSFFDFNHRIIVDPTNGDVYVGNTAGVMRSTDGGVNWSIVLLATNNGFTGTITEVILTPSGTFYAAISGEGIFRSTNGTAWTQIASGADLVAPGNGFGRIVLAYAPSDDDIIYAFYVGSNFTCGGESSNVYLRRWDDGTSSFTGNWDNDISVCADANLRLEPQGGYNLAIAVRPNNVNEVFIGGERLYRFTITSSSTGTYVFAAGDQGNPTATSMHVDNHLLVFTTNDSLWAGTDGGLRVADVSIAPVAHSFDVQGHTNGGFSWANKNSGFITYQFYRGDITPDASSTMVGGGAQDNANNLIPGPGAASFATELGGGDGVQFAIISGTSVSDFNTLNGTQFGSIVRRTSAPFATLITPFDPLNPGATWQGFDTFFLLDADNTDHWYYPIIGTSPLGVGIFRTRFASTMTFATSELTGDPTTGFENMTFMNIPGGSGDISALGVSRNAAYNDQAYTASDVNRKLYIGTDAGRVFRLADPAFGSNAVVEITPGGLTGNVSDIAVNPYDDNEILITVSNYGVSSVWHTFDASVGSPTYTEVEGPDDSAVELASVRAGMITIAGSKTLYIVGTSTGLYGTTELTGATTTWERIGTNEVAFANCVDMRLRTADNKVAVATHGNGMFVLNIPCASMTAPLSTIDLAVTDTQCPITFYANSDCSGLIAKVEATGGSPIDGSVDAEVWIDPTVQTASAEGGFNDVPYVQRHFEITPTANPTTATGRVTLFVTQAEFNAFNSHPNSTLNLPTNSGDASGIANLRVTKRDGSSTDGSGSVESFNDATPTLIDPANGDIVFNNDKMRWEITFDVTGFSGFFVHTQNNALIPPPLLPIELSAFEAKVVDKNDVALTWETQTEVNNTGFEIQRSSDGIEFEKIGFVISQGNTFETQSYNFLDQDVRPDTWYYRLKQIDLDDNFSFSEVRVVTIEMGVKIVHKYYPNPVSDIMTIEFSEKGNESITVEILNVMGRQITSFQVRQDVESYNVNNWNLQPGVYFLRISLGDESEVLSFVKI